MEKTLKLVLDDNAGPPDQPIDSIATVLLAGLKALGHVPNDDAIHSLDVRYKLRRDKLVIKVKLPEVTHGRD